MAAGHSSFNKFDFEKDSFIDGDKRDCGARCDLEVVDNYNDDRRGVTRLGSPASPRMVPVAAAACRAYRDLGARNHS
jgi:hypothetical protein